MIISREMKENMNVTLFPLLWEKQMVLSRYHVGSSNNGVSMTKELWNSAGDLKVSSWPIGAMQMIIISVYVCLDVLLSTCSYILKGKQ